MTDKTIDTLDAFAGTLSATSKFVVADGDDVLKRASGTQILDFLEGAAVAAPEAISPLLLMGA